MKLKLPDTKTVVVAVAAVSLTLNLLMGVDTGRLKFPDSGKTRVLVKQDTLTEWQIFTLALMKVESEYDSLATSSTGAKGYFQMTTSYVNEVNRIHNTGYTMSQVRDFDTAYEIFDLMQQAHNPDYNLKKALILHNGNHGWYHRKVYAEMDRIRKYEEMRNKVKNTETL